MAAGGLGALPYTVVYPDCPPHPRLHLHFRPPACDSRQGKGRWLMALITSWSPISWEAFCKSLPVSSSLGQCPIALSLSPQYTLSQSLSAEPRPGTEQTLSRHPGNRTKPVRGTDGRHGGCPAEDRCPGPRLCRFHQCLLRLHQRSLARTGPLGLTWASRSALPLHKSGLGSPSSIFSSAFPVSLGGSSDPRGSSRASLPQRSRPRPREQADAQGCWVLCTLGAPLRIQL